MTIANRAVCVVGLVTLAIALLALSPSVAAAQSDPHVGTWVLNVAKSNYTPGPPPKAQTSVYAAAGEGIKVTTSTSTADGKALAVEYTANFDGKDYPVKGNPDWDTVALKRVDSHTIEFTRKKGGKVVQTATSAVSKDGKARTVNTTGVNAQGQKIKTVGVYEKQ
jgi:hypothetical protein